LDKIFFLGNRGVHKTDMTPSWIWSRVYAWLWQLSFAQLWHF